MVLNHIKTIKYKVVSIKIIRIIIKIITNKDNKIKDFKTFPNHKLITIFIDNRNIMKIIFQCEVKIVEFQMLVLNRLKKNI